MLRTELSPEIWLSMNCLARLRLGVRERRSSAASSAAWFASVSPPSIFTNE